MKWLILKLLLLYKRLISPILGDRCRFYPSCSSYAAEAIKCHGVIYGGIFALKRVLRCNPYNPGGYDPVPDVFSYKRNN